VAAALVFNFIITMKKLQNHTIDLTRSRVLCKDGCGSELLRIGLDRYAVTAPFRDIPVFAFESLTFSRLMSYCGSMIVDFDVMRISSLLCDEPHGHYALMFVTRDGDAFRLDTSGSTEQFTALESEEATDRPALTPMQHWKLPEIFPFDHMLISKPLIAQLEPHVKSVGSDQLLKQLWRELQQTYPNRQIGGIHDMVGEFLAYSATELPCGRIVFMTSVEGLLLLPQESDLN